jgi:hypothetical protein
VRAGTELHVPVGGDRFQHKLRQQVATGAREVDAVLPAHELLLTTAINEVVRVAAVDREEIPGRDEAHPGALGGFLLIDRVHDGDRV